MFRTKCNDFLDAISQMREEAIEKNVQEALRECHLPYVEELIKTKELLIVEETEKVEKQIEELRNNLKAKIASYEEKTCKAIEEDKEKVARVARENACANYDKFILDVSRLVDETQI